MLKKKFMLTFFLILIFFSFVCLYMYVYMLKKNYHFFLKWEILFMNSHSFELIMFFDWMSFSFLSVVFFISSMVSLYSDVYMSKKKNQFINLIFLFVMSMMILILSLNLVSILMGWDGLGLVSYILIIFFQSDKSKNSGMLTILLNRIGDIMIIFSSFFLYMKSGMNFLFYYNYNSNIIMMMIILASMTKSAQMPFSTWLPAAMAAPTPVSSLVHSSTLVTAGIYLMIRFHNYFLSSIFMKFILIFSLLTMFMSGIAANYETDLKKVIALSTLSQLGFMMTTLSMNFIMLSFFHLLTHALFKAMLFLCAGIMIHNFKNNQDIQYMGGMINFMPFTVMCFNVSSLSLCGFLFLSGFFSKDLIIENYLMNNNNLLIYIILLISTSLTISYTFRLIFFLSMKKMNSFNILKLNEKKKFSFILSIMTFLCIIMGSFYNWTMFMIFYEPFMSFYMKLIIPLIFLFGFYMNKFFMYKKSFTFSNLLFLNMTIIKMKNIEIYYMNKSYISSNFGFFELIGSQGLYNYLLYISKFDKKYILYNFKLLFLLSILVFNITNL